jgi:type II secretory pathway predicted ATPase ExeA
MIGLTGDTGMGKTRSLESIKRGRNTFYVVFKKTMNARQFLSAILKELGIVFEGNKYDMVNRFAEELNVLPSPLLIVDEAGKLPHTVMQYLHDLRDYTLNNCGIVLAGMPYFEENLRKNARKQKEGCAEFLRRINLWHRMSGLSREEIEFVCAQHDITDKQTIKEFNGCKRFGDLLNQILLYRIDQIASIDTE